jgi:hypothetical protein
VGDGAPISQEIRLPTDTDGLTSAAAKLDAIIARVDKLETQTTRQERRSESSHSREKQRHRESEHGWEGVGKSIDNAKSRAREFFEFIGAVAAFEVLEKIADKFLDIGKEALHAAAMAERLNFAVDVAAGSAEHGEGVRKWLEKNAKNSEFSDQQNKAAYLQLKRYGIGDQKAGLFMKGAEDLAAVADPTQREGVYQEALSAFARVHARGKIDTRSAMRLGIGVEDFASLPQFKGQNRKQISKALQTDTAQVSENDLLNLIMHRTGEKAIGQRAVEASQLLLTRWTKITQLPEQFYEKLGETSAVKRLSEELGSALEALDPDSPTGKKIFDGLESALTFVVDTVGEIDFGAVADGVMGFVGALREAAHVASEIAHTIASIAGVSDVIGDAMRRRKKIQDIDEAKQAILDGKDVPRNETTIQMGLAPRGELLKPGVRAWHGGLHQVGTPFDMQADAGQFNMVGQGTGEGYADGIEASTPAAEKSTKRLGKKSHEALKEETDTHSPSRKAEEVGGFFGEGFARGIEGSAGRIEDAMDSTMSIPASAYGGSSVAGLGGGGVQVSFSDGAIQIIVTGGGDPASTAAAVRDELAKSIRPMFIDILEESRGEG